MDEGRMKIQQSRALLIFPFRLTSMDNDMSYQTFPFSSLFLFSTPFPSNPHKRNHA